MWEKGSEKSSLNFSYYVWWMKAVGWSVEREYHICKTDRMNDLRLNSEERAHDTKWGIGRHNQSLSPFCLTVSRKLEIAQHPRNKNAIILGMQPHPPICGGLNKMKSR